MNIFKRVKQLEIEAEGHDLLINNLYERLWRLENPPKFKPGDKCISDESKLFGRNKPIEVTILSEKCVNGYNRIYYADMTDRPVIISVIEVYEMYLTLKPNEP